MAKSLRRLLQWGVAAAVTAVAVVLVLHPVVPNDVLGPDAPNRSASLLPMAAGLLLAAVIADRPRRKQLDERAWRALEGHSMPYELTWLMALLVVFLVSTLGISAFAGAFLPTVSWEVMMPPVRILFLFVLPLIVVDLGGFTTAGYSTVMPRLAMRVTEGWRWLGTVPVAVALMLMSMAVFPAPMPSAAITIAAAIAILAAVAVPEEIFFRALVQTRLERVAGRWPGILLGAALFTAVSVFLSEFGDISPESEILAIGPLEAAVFYAAVGIFQGYLWASYRNIWLNILLRAGTLLVRILPSLQLM